MLRGVRRRRSGGAWLWLLLGLLLGGAVGGGVVWVLKREKGVGIPGGVRLGGADELALVPTDAIGFVHVRARDLWLSEPMAELRKTIEKAGPDALARFDSEFVPAPSTLDRATLVLFSGPKAGPANGTVPQPGNQPKFPPNFEPVGNKPFIKLPERVEPVGILVFTAPYDAEKFRANTLPAAVEKDVAGRKYWATPSLAAWFPSNKVLVIGTPGGVDQLVARQAPDGKQPEGPLSAPLTLAGEGGRQIVAAVNSRAFHIDLAQLRNELNGVQANAAELLELAKSAEPLLHAESFAISLALLGADDSRIDMHAYFKDDKEAEDGEKAVRALTEFAHKKLIEPRKEFEKTLKKPRSRFEDLPEAVGSLLILGVINRVDEYLANPPLKRRDREVVASLELPPIATAYASAAPAMVAMLLPAVQKVRAAAASATSQNNLKQIAIAMHGYHDAYGQFPPPQGEPNISQRLSWRVYLLPFLEEEQLYRQFRLDEPWDSPNNRRLIDRMPRVYSSPQAPAGPGQTFYKTFTGGGSMFEQGKRMRMVDITDGTSNTVMLVEGGESVIWTKPDDVPFDPSKPLPNLRLDGNSVINMCMADGSVRKIDLDRISEKTLKAAITMAGDDVLGPDWGR
jgi:hypothetical protein